MALIINTVNKSIQQFCLHHLHISKILGKLSQDKFIIDINYDNFIVNIDTGTVNISPHFIEKLKIFCLKMYFKTFDILEHVNIKLLSPE